MTDGPGQETAGPRRTAVGTVRTMMGMGYITLVGLALGIFVPRILGPEDYALFTVVISLVNWTAMVGVVSFTSGLGKLLVDVGDDWRGLAGSALTVGVLVMVVVSGGLWLAAPWLAHILGDDALTPLFRLFAIDPPLCLAFRTLAQVAQARRQYERQIIIAASYHTVRAIATVGLLISGFGVPGAIVAALCGSVTAVAVGMGMTGIGLPRYTTSLKPLFAFQWPLAIAAVLVPLTNSSGIWLVKALVAAPAAAGVYGLATMITVRIVPIIMSVNLAMAPKLVASINDGSKQATADLIRGAYRFVLMGFAPIIAVFTALAHDLVSTVFSASYADAALPAVLLLWAGLFSLLGETAGITLVAAHKPLARLWCAAGTLPLAIALNLFLIPRFAIEGAAVATLIGFALYGLVSMLASWQQFGVGPSLISVLRCGMAAAVSYGVGIAWQVNGGWVIAQAGVLVILYAGLLWVMRELTAEDLQPVAAAFRLRKGR